MTALPTPRSPEYDYIIVGGGAAGCAVAARLSEQPDVTCLLLEAGGGYPRIMSIPLIGMRHTTALSWKYFTTPQPNLNNRRISLPFGRLLGGSSSTNAMMYVRGSAAAYDQWQYLGNPGWSFADILPYFRRSECFEGGPSEFHGDSGPIHVSKPRHRAPFSTAFVQACEQSGIPPLDDFNGANAKGAGFFDVLQHDGRRSSAAVGYLDPAKERPNLTILRHATVRRILLNGSRATGVEVREQFGQQTNVHARREVILSAGAFNSPKLLMLSGIGPPDHLRQVGITPRIDLPGVGEHLTDHIRIPILYESKRSSPGSKRHWVPAALRYAFDHHGVLSSNCCEAGAMVDSRPGIDYPDLQFVTHFQSSLRAGTVDLQFCVVRIYSRGRVTLASADPDAPPLIDPNYLSDPVDIRTAIAGIRIARTIASAPALRNFPLGEEVLPGPRIDSDVDLEGYCRAYAETCYHPACTCRMGNDPMAVVDHEVRVRGVESLRIADASVMPELPNGNTCAPTYMIAEKAADLIRKSAS